MKKLQEVIRTLRHAGAVVNDSCGMHVHVDASGHTPRSLRNALSIMYSKEDLIFKAIGAKPERISQYCQYSRENVVRTVRAVPASDDGAAEAGVVWCAGRKQRPLQLDAVLCAQPAFCVLPPRTVEWRCFESTLHAGVVRANITLALAISAQAINQTKTQSKKTPVTENPAFTSDLFASAWPCGGRIQKRADAPVKEPAGRSGVAI